MTDPNRELHLGRVRSALAAIPGLRAGEDRALDPGFESWQNRTKQSLRVLFGEKHSYAREFSFLNFWLPRVSYGTGQASWTTRDEQQFQEDLVRAEQILKDALEEVEVFERPTPPTAPRPRPNSQPLSVTVINVLSQTNVVQISQLYAELESLGLPKSVESEAKLKAAELDAEVRGEQRWPVLAKTLDGIKALGKPVYEKVAIPLLLEMLKKQAGL